MTSEIRSLLFYDYLKIIIAKMDLLHESENPDQYTVREHIFEHIVWNL